MIDLRVGATLISPYTPPDDPRRRAITYGRIADILQERGQLDDALRIFEQQVLPSFEALNLPAELVRVRARIAELRAKLG